MDLYIGIDPGEGGAIGAIPADRSVNAVVVDFESGLDTLEALSLVYSPTALLERQWTRPGFRPIDKILVNYGKWIGALTILKIPFATPTPIQWQGAMFRDCEKVYKTVKKKGVTIQVIDTKAMSLKVANRLFPYLRDKLKRKSVDHNRADALLIAEYCRRLHEGVV